MTAHELKAILDKYMLWLQGSKGGEYANLDGANLEGADLYGANLYGAKKGSRRI